MLDRCIFRVEVSEKPFPADRLNEMQHQLAEDMWVSFDDAAYLMSTVRLQKDMYSVDDDSIDILYKDGTTRPITQASELLNVELLSKKVSKYLLCYQRT